MLTPRGKVVVALVVGSLGLAGAFLSVRAANPFNPTLNILLSNSNVSANSDITTETSLAAGDIALANWALFLPDGWSVSKDTFVPYGDVVAHGEMSVDVDCNGSTDNFSFDLINEPADPQAVAQWSGQIASWWTLLVSVNQDPGQALDMSASMTNFSVFHSQCTPQTFTLTFLGRSSPGNAVVLTNPSSTGTYTFQGSYVSLGGTYTAIDHASVCVGASCPTPTPTPTAMPTATPTPSPTPCADSDGDGWTDCQEAFIGTSAGNACTPGGWPPDPEPAPGGSGSVQIDDVAQAAGRFGAQTGGPKYAARVEIASQNGYVQIDDIAAFAGRFGNTCAVSCPDSDGDGWTDCQEAFIGTSAGNPCTPGGWPPDPQPAPDGNGSVQIDDVAYAAGRFGTQTGSPGYAARAEIASQNGYIQIDDIAALAGRFGDSCGGG